MGQQPSMSVVEHDSGPELINQAQPGCAFCVLVCQCPCLFCCFPCPYDEHWHFNGKNRTVVYEKIGAVCCNDGNVISKEEYQLSDKAVARGQVVTAQQVLLGGGRGGIEVDHYVMLHLKHDTRVGAVNGWARNRSNGLNGCMIFEAMRRSLNVVNKYFKRQARREGGRGGGSMHVAYVAPHMYPGPYGAYPAPYPPGAGGQSSDSESSGSEHESHNDAVAMPKYPEWEEGAAPEDYVYPDGEPAEEEYEG
eukprot:gnl/Hemi2/3760_TR1315_c0_g1_i1.p2 gnl/Hemi2/3760_TR1315_c0_g1~~gnl/Hemi2/3760_TR1315_c0_g1_i1.p2  ORF type:complete len:250 (+),score=80.94 gnl/Hemi2/3760_TR1315_c0_g1_i1:97-846(+)